MGYPNQLTCICRPSLLAVLVLLLALSFPVLDGYAAPARPPGDLPPGHWDHVIITDQSLKPIFAPLAKHRKGQGLRCRIVSTKVLGKWAGQDDPQEAIRWFVDAAVQQWGTRYVLLGGDADIIPVPLGYFESPNFSWDIPLDLYYAAPHGDWDLDGDGILGETGDDAPDLTPAVALGRAPVATRDEAWAFVHKVIAFENQNADGSFDALLAAEVGSPYPWSPGMEIHFDFAREMELVAEILASMDAVGEIQRLYQNPEAPFFGVPLSADNFLAALAAGRHRFAGMMVRGTPETWSMGADFLRPDMVEALAPMDHSVFLAGSIMGAADFRGDSVLKNLLTLPDGGCAGALAPGAPYFLAGGNPFFREFWETLTTGECDRVGDAYRQVMESRLAFHDPRSAPLMATLQCLNIVGDPALLFLPAGGREKPVVPNDSRKLTASVSPNPFNPSTEISFIIPEGDGARVRTGVEIFDLGGRRLAKILDDDLAPGTHVVQWFGQDDSGRKVGSGVFFARIQAGSRRTVEKLILVE